MVNKRGQLGNLQAIIAVLIIVGVLIGIGLIVLDDFLSRSNTATASVTNETGGFINETGYQLGAFTVSGFNSPAIVTIRNSTGGDDNLLTTGNFTLSSSAVLTNASVTTWPSVNVSYTYLRGTNGASGVNSTIIAFLTIPSLLGLIVLIAMVGIILAIVFNVIPGARVSGA